jgi:hypothetical protein
MLGPIGSGGVTLSRGDASQIRQGIAKAIGWSDEDLAIRLSLAQQAKTDDDHQAEASRTLRALGILP